MADKQVGQVQFLLQIPQQVNDLCLNGYVKGGDGFVADNDLRFDDQRSGDADTLALSSGKGVGIAHQVHGVQANLLRNRLCPLIHLGLGHFRKVCLQRFLDDVENRHPGVERRVGILENHLDFLSDFLHLLFIHLQEVQLFAVLCAIEDLALRGVVGPHDTASQRGFSAAGFAYDADGFSRLYVEADIRYRLYCNTLGSKALVQALDFHDIVFVHALASSFFRIASTLALSARQASWGQLKQAILCPGDVSTSSGSARLQSPSMRTSQRS